MVSGTYRDLFVAVATSASALTGLLFVAISVAPRQNRISGPLVIQQVRAAAALLAFVNALAVSLFSLAPDTNAGHPAVTLGVIGILFTAAAIRSIRTSQTARPLQRRQIGLIFLLLLIFGTELRPDHVGDRGGRAGLGAGGGQGHRHLGLARRAHRPYAPPARRHRCRRGRPARAGGVRVRATPARTRAIPTMTGSVTCSPSTVTPRTMATTGSR